MSFKAIRALLEKDCTTITKEIKVHMIHEKKGASYRPFNDRIHRRKLGSDTHPAKREPVRIITNS